jgi:hypothetical protein
LTIDVFEGKSYPTAQFHYSASVASVALVAVAGVLDNRTGTPDNFPFSKY